MRETLQSRTDHAEAVCIDTTWGVEVEVLRTFYRTQRFSRHFHDTFTIGLGLQGAGSIWYRGRNHSRGAREIVIIPPGELHTGGVSPRARCVSYMALYLPPEVFAACADVEGFRSIEATDYGAPVISDVGVAGALGQLHEVLWPAHHAREKFRSPPPDLAAVEDAIHLIVAGLLHRASGAASPSRNSSAAPGPGGLAGRIRQVVEDCYPDPVRTSLRAIAACVGVSPFHVVRTFTRATGLSPHQYLIQRRVTAARQLLAGGQPPSLVAAAVGFADQSHLTMHFKRITGITPSHYQRCVSHH